jgi:hypothetical protein
VKRNFWIVAKIKYTKNDRSAMPLRAALPPKSTGEKDE